MMTTTNKTLYHRTHPYLLDPIHPVTVNVIGAGGTGSHVLTSLARLNEALIALGHRGLFVTAYDSDEVSEANIGRQMFSPADLGINKAVTMITRINRHFGNNWRAIPMEYSRKTIDRGDWEMPMANITITCVDTIKARKEVKATFSQSFRKSCIKNYDHPHSVPLYWIDFGNLQRTGQIILATVQNRASTDDSISCLPDLFTLFSKMKKQKDDDTVPSCSLQEALRKQDLFINSILAQNGMNILWTMFRDTRISHQGMFINLETLKTSPLAIRKHYKKSKAG